MARQSPTHYITPSALSIIPNANELASDIAVFLQANTTIRAYSPRAGLDMVDKDYRSWPITGRNRRLADATKPYTIYARLPKAEGGKAYVTFAPKVWSEAEQRWLDKYAYITPDGPATDTAPDVTDENNWYAKLGDVSLPEGEAGEEQRTVTLDTGILGTAEYNTEWNVSPDALPLRLSMECRIDGVTPKEAGPTPYVYWNQVATLAATLTEGWTGTDIQNFDHWEIARDTDNETADAEWNAAHNGATNPNGFWASGVINLNHHRGTGEIDDFDGTVSAVFIINAMRLNPEWEEGSSAPQYIVLKSASINIMAETIERFEVAPTTAVMAFNPMTGAYTPSNGILLCIRAITQKGDASQISNGQFAGAGLSCQYAPEGSSTWTEITSSGPSARTWGATVPVSAFSDGKSVNVRILRDNTELHRATIAYVRDGEDSKEREWIFLRSATAITFGTQDHPYPANIAQGQVNPTGEASGTDENKNQDGWVPNGWWNNPQGSTEEYPYEYGAYRDHGANGWGAFTAPSIWTHYGKDGKDGENAQYIYLKGTARDGDNSIITTVQNETSITGGSNEALHGRGLNLVTLNRRTLAVVERKNYDTYLEGRGDAGATGITDLIAKIDTLDDTVFICLTSFDAIGWNDSLISTLQLCGMSDLPYTALGRYPFLFVGYKNLGKGNGLTRMRNVGHYDDVVELSAYVAGGALTVKDGQDGQKGEAGGNTATVMLYKRSASAVTSVGISATLYYKFATKKLYTDAACTTEATTQLNGWSLGIPSGTNPIYATSAVAYSTEDHDDIGSTEWVTPVQFTGNGEDGISTAVVLLYKRSATSISVHGITATLHYKFADGKLYTKNGSTYTEATAADLNNWSRDIPASDGNPCYAIQAAALGTGDYDPVAPADWSGATKIVEDGTDGQDMRENLIDHSRPQYIVDLSDESQRWQTYTDNDLRYITDKVFDPDVIPDGTPLSGQMRLTLSGCTYASDATVGIYMSGVNRWPFFARLAPVSADGTYIVKMEGLTIASGHGAWDGKVYLQVKGCGTSGTVSVSRVKLEVGEKCSDWCLSENDKKGQQGPQGAAGGPSKVYRRLIAGCIYFCASDGAAERVGVLNSQDYVAVRAKNGDGYDSGWIMYRCTESFVATAAAIANLNEAIADYEGGGETTKSQIDAAMAASSLTPQSSGIPLGKGAFAEIATNQTAAFFTQLVAKNANIEVLTGAQYYIVDENNVTAGGFGKVEDENDGNTYMIWAGGEAPSAAPFAVDSAGNVKMETGVFGGFLKNTARVITAKNVKDYVSWGKTEDWYVDSTTGTYKQRKGWILNLDKAGSNVIFFSGEAAIWGTETYDSIKLELERLASEEHADDYTDGVDYYNEIYIPLPWYANQVALSIGGETGNADWVSYAARLGHSTLVDDWAYTQPNVALQYIDSHYRVVNATSDIYDKWWKIHFAGLARLGDMGWGVGLPSFISGEACEWILLCNASSRGTGSDEAYGVWWTTVMSYGSQAAGGAHLFSAAWMYVYGLIPL